MTKEGIKIAYILPAYNEEAAVVQTINSIPKIELEQLGYRVEIVLVNNNSNDNTVALAQEHGVTVIEEKIQGYGASYKRGFSSIDADIFICGDCDFTYPFNDSIRLLEIMETENLDFITTNRFHKGNSNYKNMNIINILGNLLLTTECKVLYGEKINDIMSGMWVIRSSKLKTLTLISDGMSFSIEIKMKFIHSLKCVWKEIPIPYNKRIGDSKLNIVSDGFSSFLYLLLNRHSHLPSNNESSI